LIVALIGATVYILFYACLEVFKETQAFKIKVKYFASCLEKDAAFYDV